MKRLESLVLDGNQIDDAGLAQLAKMRNFREVEIRNVPGITIGSVDKLRRLRHGLRVQS